MYLPSYFVKNKYNGLSSQKYPFAIRNHIIPHEFKDVLKTLALIIISIAACIIILVGIYLSCQLSFQIIQLLKKSRYITREISKLKSAKNVFKGKIKENFFLFDSFYRADLARSM